MKRLDAIVCVFATWTALSCSHLTQSLVKRAIPAFSELPAPVEDLSNGQTGLIYFNTSTPFDLDVLWGDPSLGIPTTGVGTLFLPDFPVVPKSGPQTKVPAMIVLHGSGGISPGREMEYGKLLADHGIAVFVLNDYLPRGVTDDTDYMPRVLSVTEFDAIADAYAALELLSTHPAIDGDRVGGVGFSYGGMASRFAMDERIHQSLAPDHKGFALYVDDYGPCFQNLDTRATNGGPLLTLRGTEDASNDLAACAQREDELRTIGTNVEAHVFEAAGHAWEVTSPREMLPDAPYLQGCEVKYSAKGRSSANGQPVVDLPIETSRMDRILIRVSSGDQMKGCVKHGYVIGRDDATKAKTDALLLAFLQREFGTR